MQPAPSRPAPGGAVRRGAVLRPSDRRMLQAVRDNLSHVHHAPAAAAVNITLPRRPDYAADAQNGCCGVVTGDSGTSAAVSRLHYNKKAMDEIRQSLQNYHVTYDTAAAAAATSHHAGNNVLQHHHHRGTVDGKAASCERDVIHLSNGGYNNTSHAAAAAAAARVNGGHGAGM